MIDEKKVIEFLREGGNLKKLLGADIDEYDVKSRAILRDTGALAFYPPGSDGMEQLVSRERFLEGAVSFDLEYLKQLIAVAESFHAEDCEVSAEVRVSISQANPLYIITSKGTFALAPKVKG